VIAFCGSLFVYISFGIVFFIISHFTYKESTPIQAQTAILFDLTQFQESQDEKNTKVMPEPPVKQEMPKPTEQKPIIKEIAKQPKEAKPISKPLNQNKQVKVSPSSTKFDSQSNVAATKQNIPQAAAPKKIDSSTFEAMVKNRINQYKFYPPIAKNRGIEGVIEASFVILPNGNVSEITVSGPNALKSAAREAITRAFPIDVSSCPISLPATMHISLRYSLLSE
jgi:protein TonB